MIRAGEIVGRPVIVREGGREAGRIKDVVVDQAGKRVLGFVISEGFLRATRVAPWGGLLAIGPDSVILGGARSVVSAGEAPDIKAVLDGDTNIRGLRLQTTGGKDLGKVEDFHFDEQTGQVEGYELSGGILPDTMGGRTFLPTPQSIELGTDVALVTPEVEATIREQLGRRIFGKSES